MRTNNHFFDKFSRHCDNSPTQIAVVFEDTAFSYEDLRTASARVATWLSEQFEGRFDACRVVLSLPKSPLSYAIWLACIRQGVVYSFVDPFGPESRTQSIIEQLEPNLVISTQVFDNPFGTSVVLDDLSNPNSLSPLVDTMVDPESVHINDPVYVMFTSGSTGKPKGVVVACRGLMNLMIWGENHVAPMVRSDTKDSPIIWANINPLHFDNSVFDLFCGLLNGHTLVPIETGALPNPAQWVKTINRHGVELIFCVPTLFQTLNQLRMLTTKRLPTVRLFSFGGEGYPIQALAAFYTEFKGRARLLNVYGPTEISCICSSIEIDDDSLSIKNVTFPSIGRMHNGHIPLILKADGTVAASGEVGELWIGGDGVALGYFNDPSKTSTAFLQTPVHDLYTDIWYRTGDLVSIDAHGYMWFSGRTDNQVKIRGYRIELEEIDATIERFKGVSRANTVVISKGDADELVTVYITSSNVTAADILEYSAVHLPKYMVPRQVIKMDKLPQNANGKVDRKAIKALVELQQ